MFNKDYILSLMPKLNQEEKKINKQWNCIQKEIISRAKRGYNTYYCYYWEYEEKIWKLLRENDFQVYVDWISNKVEVRW